MLLLWCTLECMYLFELQFSLNLCRVVGLLDLLVPLFFWGISILFSMVTAPTHACSFWMLSYVKPMSILFYFIVFWFILLLGVLFVCLLKSVIKHPGSRYFEYLSKFENFNQFHLPFYLTEQCWHSLDNPPAFSSPPPPSPGHSAFTQREGDTLP